VCQTLLKQKAPREIKAHNKWNTTLTEDNIDWKYMYMKPIKLTNETKLRAFQFNFFNRIVPSNSFLYKCKLASSSLCDFCNSIPDSLQHMFWECQHIQHFWTNFTSQILAPLKTTKYVNLKNIVWCNILEERDTNSWIVNYLMLLAKYFIFRSKCLNQIPVITVFHTYVKNRMVVEEVIATMHNKLNTYNAKWQVYKQTFQWVLTCNLSRKQYSLVLYSYPSILTAHLSPFSNSPTATTSHLKTLWKSACCCTYTWILFLCLRYMERY